MNWRKSAPKTKPEGQCSTCKWGKVNVIYRNYEGKYFCMNCTKDNLLHTMADSCKDYESNE